MKNLYAKMFEIQGLSVKKDAENPFFKSKYMSLDNILQVLTPILNKNKWLLFHSTKNKEMVTTIYDLEHDEELSSNFPLIESNDPQKLGSCITYAKRYNIGQLFNIITDEDDDGNANEKPQQQPQQQVNKQVNKQVETAKQVMGDLGDCDNCGAKNAMSQKGKKYCSAKCWL